MQISHQHWRESAIERSEIVTDAWEVTKVWAGRFAEWVLFVCMIATIIEILPGVTLSLGMSNTILGIQAVMLDVAGFGLATMAAYAQQEGNPILARRARITAWVLITIMLLTVLSVALSGLWPSLKASMEGAEKVLILVRVGMTVIYGHVIHSLRRHQSRTGSAWQAQEVHLEQLVQRLTEVANENRVPLNYEQLAASMVPLLPKLEPTLNYEVILTDMLTELSHMQAQKEAAVAGALTTLQATVDQLMHEIHGVEPDLEPLNKGQDEPHLELVRSHEKTEIGSMVQRFIECEREQGHIPTLTEIMNATGCSKGSASRYRSAVLNSQSA